MVDRLRVPQRLEQHVGEAQREEILDRFLAEIMVDAEDAVFGKGVADLGVDFARRGEVVADRLFHRDAAFGAGDVRGPQALRDRRSEEHTSELQSLMRISYAVFCLKKKKKQNYLIPTINNFLLQSRIR